MLIKNSESPNFECIINGMQRIKNRTIPKTKAFLVSVKKHDINEAIKDIFVENRKYRV